MRNWQVRSKYIQFYMNSKIKKLKLQEFNIKFNLKIF